MSNGFKVQIVSYEEISVSLGVVLHSRGNHDKIMFIAQQLRFSDDQVIMCLSTKDTTQLGVYTVVIFCN